MADSDPAVTGIRATPPLSAGEATTAIVHYYRAEMARMSSWRSRLDMTSNWAITVVAAMLSVSLSTTTAHHGLVLFAALVISLLLYIEARRYRFYDVYRMRVRQFERHYFAPLFAGAALEANPWFEALAVDLRHPRFRIGLTAALRRRLRRNYIFMYVILALAWVVKIASPQLGDGSDHEPGRPLEVIIGHAAIGAVPGWVVVILVASALAVLVIFALSQTRRIDDDEVRV
jgi:uncharacterized membrane protein